jgi:hypothetical protein
MLKRIVPIAAVALISVCSCGRHGSDTDHLPTDTKQLFAIWADAEKTWGHLQRDLAAGHFWMAWRYAHARVRFNGQPVFDSSRNPILVSIWKTPIWCHVVLTPSEFSDVQKERTQVDSFSMAVLGRVEKINWYTKHVTLTSLQSYTDAGQ